MRKMVEDIDEIKKRMRIEHSIYIREEEKN